MEPKDKNQEKKDKSVCRHNPDGVYLDVPKREGDIYHFRTICGKCGLVMREWTVDAGKVWKT